MAAAAAAGKTQNGRIMDDATSVNGCIMDENEERMKLEIDTFEKKEYSEKRSMPKGCRTGIGEKGDCIK